MTFPIKFFNRGSPLRSLLIDREIAEIVNAPKTITITNESDLEFGDIAADDSVQIGLEYVSTESEQFWLAVAFQYEGDAGAFTYSAGDGTGDFGTPIPLVDGDTFWTVVPPDTIAAAPYNLTITALGADAAVEKTGTVSIVDRFDYADTGDPLRVLRTFSLSKTYVP